MKLEPEWNGLTVLTEGKDPIVDIVFIHGLQGHPRQSWTYTSPAQTGVKPASKPSSRLLSRFRSSKQDVAVTPQHDTVFWPLDLLPSDVQNARIVSFGYNSQILGFFYGANNQNSLFAHARNLLQELLALRRNNAQRKLIFAAHSMGGLIVKDVLRRARNLRDQPKYKDLYESTYVCNFFGTPHRGSDMTGWATLARRLALAVLQDSNAKLIRNLESNDEALDLLREDFAQVLGERSIKLHTFQEERGMTGVKGLSGKVVEDFSSSLDDVLEDRQGIDADHQNMIRFSGPSDPGYRKFRNTLQQDLLDLETGQKEATEGSEIEMTEEKTALLNTLFFSYLRDQSNGPKAAQAGTFEWLLDDSKYLECLQGTENRLLWISGKPGSGKSTIFVKMQQDVSQRLGILLLSFAFKASTEDLAGSAEGLFRGLLYQILTLEPHCFDLVLPLLRSGHDNENPRFLTSASQLSVAFRKCLEVVRARRILLLIDALDECEVESSAMVTDLLRGLVELRPAQPNRISIILTSRPTELVQHRLRDSLKLDLHDMNGQDIAAYVNTRARIFEELYPKHHKDVQQLMEIVAEHAQGIFLWAVLVLDDLQQEAIEGKSIESIVQHFEAVPRALEGLYQNMLERLLNASAPDIEETRLLIKWVILATRSLHLRELWASRQLQQTADDPAKHSSHYDEEVMTRWVRARSGGLFEVVSVDREQEAFGSKKTWKNSFVVPIHLSVYHFLAVRKDVTAFDAERASLSIQDLRAHKSDHAIIAKACVRYCGSRQKRDFMDSVFYRLGTADPDAQEPLPYALQAWGYHAEQAELYGTCLYDSFAEIAINMELEDRTVHSYYKLEDPESHTMTSLAAIAARFNLSLTLARLIDEGITWNSRPLLESNPCLSACHGNNLEALRTLCNTCGLDPGIECCEAAGKYGHTEIMKFLIDLQSDSARKDAFLYKAMHEAAAQNQRAETIVQYLIEELGADVNRPAGGTGGIETTLTHACWAKKDRVAEILLVHGADPNLRRKASSSEPAALHRALHSGSDRIVQLLLDYGADVDIDCSLWGTPLMCAARFGRDNMAKLLLSHGANPNKRGGVHATALQTAATRGNLQISIMLIDAGAEVNAIGGRYYTAIQAAAYGANPAVMKLLIENGADVNLEGGHYYVSALNAAATSNKCDMLRMILNAGTAVPQRCPFTEKRPRVSHRSALHAALAHHNLEGVALLLDHGATIAEQDAVRVLRSAFQIKDPDLYKILMSKCDGDVPFDSLLMDTICKFGYVPADEKVQAWHEEIITMTLEQGANPDARAPFEGAVPPSVRSINQKFPDGSALQHAAAHKNTGLVRILLANRANVNLVTQTGTPLQVACELGDLDMVRLLLDHGADVNLEIPKYGSHLQAVAQIRGNLGRKIPTDDDCLGKSSSDMWDRLRTTPIGPPRNVNGDNVTEIASLLLEHGAEVTYNGSELGSALHAAGTALSQELITTFLQHGADLHAVAGKYGTLLQAVTSAREFEEHRVEFRDKRAEEVKTAIASLLIRKGAKVNAQAGHYHTALQGAAYSSKSKALLLLLLRNSADVNAQGGQFATVLQAAAACWNHEFLSVLLQHGADPNVVGGKYGSPLIAIFNKDLFPCQNQHRACLDLLLKSGADPNFVHEWYGAPLHMAAEFEDVEACKVLLSAGASINMRAGRRLYPLLALAQTFTNDPRNWSLETLRLFLEAGADVHCSEPAGCTPLLHAVNASSSGSFEACEMLLEHGADVNQQCDCHGSILQAAVGRYDNAKLLALLIDKGADVGALGEEHREKMKETDARSCELYNLTSKLRQQLDEQY